MTSANRMFQRPEDGRLALLTFVTVLVVLFVLASIARSAVPDLLAALSVDSVGFEAQAREIAAIIALEGWQVWSLTPNGQAPVGIASMSLVIFGDTMLPVVFLNATLLAAAATATVLLVARLQPTVRWPAFGAFAFMLPSVSLVAAVVHKDPFAIFGVSFILLGLSCCVEHGCRGRLPALVSGLALVGIGSAAIWLVRPYANVLMLGGASAFVLTFVVVGVAAGMRRAPLVWGTAGGALCVLLLSMVVGFPALEGRPQPSDLVAPMSGVLDKPDKGEIKQCWIDLPQVLEARLGYLLSARQGLIDCCSDATTAIDIDVRLDSICDLAGYIPRATAVGFLAPFPRDWVAPGRSGLTAFLVGAEMSLVYLALIGVFIALLRTSTAWLLPMIVFTVVIIVALVIAFPNIGTLYRMRMPYLLPILAIGLAALADGARKGVR